MNKKQKQ